MLRPDSSTVTQNYDTGCLLVDGTTWRNIGPSGTPSTTPREIKRSILEITSRRRSIPSSPTGKGKSRVPNLMTRGGNKRSALPGRVS